MRGINKKIKIRKVSGWSIGITIFLFIAVQGGNEFRVVQDTTDRYILCEKMEQNILHQKF